jgi:CRP/FNR family transcriptional regulator, cyclic AMP receptor protein
MSTTYLDRRFYDIGDVIFTEGDTSSEMFIVQEGRVAVTKDVAGREVFLAMLERGDFFGEMALLDSQPRHATCYAMAPTLLLAIKSGELLIKLRRDPTFALEMLQAMSRRIRYLDDHVTKLMEDQMLSRQEIAKALARSEYQHRGPHR